jgi:hypothetical protein
VKNNQQEKAMKAAFIVSTAVLTDPVLNKFIPRPVRKTLRLTTPRSPVRNAERHTTLTHYLTTAYRDDAYHNANLYTQEHDADEFGDIDNEHEGLTITEPMDEVELWKFCTGYDVL